MMGRKSIALSGAAKSNVRTQNERQCERVYDLSTAFFDGCLRILLTFHIGVLTKQEGNTPQACQSYIGINDPAEKGALPSK